MRNELALGLMVAFSLLLTMLLELIPLPLALGINPWRAPWLLVMVMFWIVYRPTVIGIGVAWIAGLFLDATSAAPLGTHALIFTLASALTLAARRLLLTFSVIHQALWMTALSMMQYGILLLILPSTELSGMFQSAFSAGLFWLALHFVLYPWIQSRLRPN
jgi:rod shape-determining protein MreD